MRSFLHSWMGVVLAGIVILSAASVLAYLVNTVTQVAEGMR